MNKFLYFCIKIKFVRIMKSFLAIVLSMVCLGASAQTWEQIQNDSRYIWGEGYGNSIEEADNNALSALISKLVVNVAASTSSNDRQTVRNGSEVTEVSQFEASAKTYSQATLTNTERVIITNEPDACVGRWILKSEIQKIFASRIAKIKDLVSMADKAESKGRVDDALRQYYWALTLLKSLQYPNEVKCVDGEGTEHVLAVWIPQRMKEVFDGLEARVDRREGDEVELCITYGGKPVGSVDYTYFDGKGWSNIYSAKDGRGVLELTSGYEADRLQLKYEFEYRGQTRLDREVESVMSVVSSTPMRSAYANVRSSASKSAAKESVAGVRESFTSLSADKRKAPAAVTDVERYRGVTERVVAAIQRKDYDSVRQLFTANGWDVYTRLVRYGRARLVGTPRYEFYSNGNYVMGRGVQMAFSFARGVRKSFVEDVVFSFDSEGRIDNLAFGLGNTAADDILCNGVWSETARVAVMNFLENYKTAYALKRIDYIESIFDDNAVIIVGSMAKVQQRVPGDGGKVVYNNILRKNRYTKDTYLRNLKGCFAANEFINIRFANNDVYKMSSGGELYAIQIAQDYYSSNYADKGYLFLMVDINDPEKPIIKVRTWQPEKDPNFGLYGPGDF